MAPFHQIGENPTLALERDMELIEWLDRLGFDEAWIGEHHSAGWETISSPEIFIGAAAQRTNHIKLGTGVISLPYHHPLMAANRMLQLDHMTRGRVMMGVGPGALVGDAFMMGIDPPTQRRRMDEALGIILRLWTEKEPITYESEWFTLREARAQLRPYSQPHMPVAVAASKSLAGMISAGKYGVGVLSLNTVRLPGAVAHDLAEFWQIAEETAAENNKTVNRNDWGLALHVHLAGSRKEAIEQARVAAGRYQRLYYEDILGLPQASDVSEDKIIDYMVETNNWCVGTPDDLVEHILRLDEESGGFGRALACEPDLLVLDEPTTGLDVTTEAAFLELVVDLKHRINAGILFVSHNLGVIAKVAERVVVMYAGETVEEAPVRELFKDPKHPYTAGLLSCVPKPPGEAGPAVRLSSIPGVVFPAGEASPSSCLFSSRCPLSRASCESQAPPMVATNHGHLSRCVHWDEVTPPVWGDLKPIEQAERSQSEAILAAKGLRRFYGRWQRKYILFGPPVSPPVRAVMDVDFNLRLGRTLGIVGESGSGKTTVARAIVGLAPRDRGELRLQDEELAPQVEHSTQAQRGAMRMVFQNPTASLNPKLPVRHAILPVLPQVLGSG